MLTKHKTIVGNMVLGITSVVAIIVVALGTEAALGQSDIRASTPGGVLSQVCGFTLLLGAGIVVNNRRAASIATIFIGVIIAAYVLVAGNEVPRSVGMILLCAPVVAVGAAAVQLKRSAKIH